MLIFLAFAPLTRLSASGRPVNLSIIGPFSARPFVCITLGHTNSRICILSRGFFLPPASWVRRCKERTTIVLQYQHECDIAYGVRSGTKLPHVTVHHTYGIEIYAGIDRTSQHN
ncbi:hypothetical protein VUR80DRAFT_3951 [Thermomyces stellatus]